MSYIMRGSGMKNTDNLVWGESSSGAYNLILYNTSSGERSRSVSFMGYDMFTLFVYVPEGFRKGEIQIATEYVNPTSARPINYYDNCLVDYDVNGDGEVTISDINTLINGIISNDGSFYSSSYSYLGYYIFHNIISIDKVTDYMLSGYPYNGYKMVKTSNKSKIRQTGGGYRIFIAGDLDNNNQVSITDVTMLIDYLLSNEADGIDLDYADVNEDGKVNIEDVTALIDYLLSGSW